MEYRIERYEHMIPFTTVVVVKVFLLALFYVAASRGSLKTTLSPHAGTLGAVFRCNDQPNGTFAHRLASRHIKHTNEIRRILSRHARAFVVRSAENQLTIIR